MTWIQMAPGAVNVTGVDFENGHGTVVNGLREDFNGLIIKQSNSACGGASWPPLDTSHQ